MKRTLSLVTVITVLLSSLIFSAAAAEAPVIDIDNKTVTAGSTVTLDVSIRGNPGITAMYFDIYYDKELTLIKAEDTGLFGGALFAEDIASYPYRVSWDESSLSTANTSDGEILRLVFSVPADTKAGTYNVDIDYDKEEIYDSALKNINVAINEGSVTVREKIDFINTDRIKLCDSYAYFISGTKVSELLISSPDGTVIKDKNEEVVKDGFLKSGYTVIFSDNTDVTCVCFGDADGDGKISASDARKTLRFAVSLEKEELWQKEAADVDFNGIISSSDAREILRSSVGLSDAGKWLDGIAVSALQMTDMNSPIPARITSDKSNFALAGEYLTKELKSFNKDVNIYKYSISVDDAYALVLRYVQNVPSLFYVRNSVNVTYVGDVLKSLHFSFCDNAEEKCRDYENRISEIVSLADNSWTEAEIVLFYHDYVAVNFSYDTDYEIHDAYSILVSKKGVCQAYSLLFSELVGRHGIEVQYVTSTSMVHGWNVVRIGNNWYHVDVTWDDPLYDRFGLVQHNNILLSDSAIKKNGHTSWKFSAESVECTDRTYDNYFWKDVTSPFVSYDGLWYYVLKKGSDVTLCRTDFQGKHSVLARYESFWMDGYDHYWKGCYSGLALWYSELVFNTSDYVIVYSPHSNKTRIIYDDKTDKSIYGIMASDTIKYNLNKAPDTKEHSVFSLDFPVPGDTDKNGLLNAKDVTVLIRSLNGHTLNVDIDAADADLDGRISARDADIIRRLVVNKY